MKINKGDFEMENIVLAKVNGKEITRDDVDFLLSTLPPERAQAFANPNGMQQVLFEVINQELFYNYAKDSGLEDTDEFAAEVERLKAHVLKNLAVRNLLDNIEVSEEEKKEFYEINKEMFKSQAMVRASHILVPELEMAEKALAEINEGRDFAEIAMEISTCPSKERGGDLDFFTRGRMVPEFEQAAFALEVGEVSEPVETQFGYHIIKTTEKKEEGVSEYKDVQIRIEHELVTKKQTEVYMEKIEELKEKYPVEMI